ncbi:putative sodium-coupled neutral amino acid transporter 7, partial [Fragariocoptes setiger]
SHITEEAIDSLSIKPIQKFGLCKWGAKVNISETDCTIDSFKIPKSTFVKPKNQFRFQPILMFLLSADEPDDVLLVESANEWRVSVANGTRMDYFISPSGSSDANRVQPEDFGSIRSLSSDSSQIKQVSQWSALFMTVNVTIGAGLLAIPAGLQTSGLFIALALQGFMLIMIIGSCIMLTYLTAVSGANSYHELLEIYGNKLLFNLCNTFVLLLTFGTAVAFQVIIADQFDRVYDTLYGNNFCHTWYLSRSFTMTVTTFFMIGPLCYSKSIGFLKYASFLGIISIGFISYVVISELLNHDPPELPVNFYPKKWTDSFSLVPSLCFAYQCHLSWVPTAAALPRMEKKKSCVTVTAALIVASIVYTVMRNGEDIAYQPPGSPYLMFWHYSFRV